MDVVKLLRSLEELFFEAITWLVTYPRLLWQIIRRPTTVSVLVQQEMAKPPEQRYANMLSPALFLILSVLLAHFLEIVLKIALPKVSLHISGELISNQKALLLYRCLAFAIWPLVASVLLLLRSGRSLARGSLQSPLSEQCYLVAPFAIALSLGLSLIQLFEAQMQWPALALVVLASLWYLSAQTRWFGHALGRQGGAAFLMALLATLLGLAINLVFAGLLPNH